MFFTYTQCSPGPHFPYICSFPPHRSPRPLAHTWQHLQESNTVPWSQELFKTLFLMQCIPAQCGGHLIKLVKLALLSASTDRRNKSESKQLRMPMLLVYWIYCVYFNGGCLFWYFVKLCKYLLWYVLTELLVVSLLNILNIFYSLNSNKENIRENYQT